jgi:tetratricopeptide (TPR) repeat protein
MCIRDNFPSLRIFLSLAPVACVAFMVILPAAAQQSVSLTGQIRTAAGSAIPMGASVSLESDEGVVVAREPASSAGQFEFSNLMKMTYKLAVTADGYEPYQQEINLTYGAAQYNVNIFLNPLNARKVAAPPALTSDMNAPKLARKEYEKGEAALKARSLREARTHMEKAVAIYPCYARALTDLALIESQEKNVADAHDNLEAAIKCDGNFLDSYSMLAQLFRAEGKYQEAEATLQNGVRISPSSWQLYDQLGSLHYAMGRYKDAERDLLQAQSFNSDLPSEFHATLANVYLKEQVFDKAYAEMQTYLQEDPDGKFAPSVRRISREMVSAGVASPTAKRNSAPVDKP